MPRVPPTFKAEFFAQPKAMHKVMTLYEMIKEKFNITPQMPNDKLGKDYIFSKRKDISQEEYDVYVDDLNSHQPEEVGQQPDPMLIDTSTRPNNAGGSFANSIGAVRQNIYQHFQINGPSGNAGGPISNVNNVVQQNTQQQPQPSQPQNVTVTCTVVFDGKQAKQWHDRLVLQGLITPKFAEKYLKHCQHALKQKQMKEGSFQAAMERGRLEEFPKNSGGTDAEPLLPDFFVYQLLPKGVSLQWSVTDGAALETCEPEQINCTGQTTNPTGTVTDKEIQWQRFEKMLNKFNDKPYPYITPEQLQDAYQKMTGKFIAIETLMNDLVRREMLQFAATVFSTPKGILLYGPPGTGKSAISSELCTILNLQFAAPPMAAGDFNKGIVGDSERMLNAIADRARLVPWEMCVLLIDEIDTLAPNRDDPANAGNKGGDLLGVFLAILDGSKATPNLKIIASTNMKPKMDEAFLRRMEIQMFMGNPSSEARRQWITFKTKKCQGRPFYNEILNFVSDPVESDYFTTRTMNFSQDALRKVLERFLERSMRIEGQPSQYHGNQLTQKLREIADSSIQNVAEEMRVKIGGMTVCDILGKSRQNLADPAWFTTVANGREGPDQNGLAKVLTKRMLIDLKAPLDETLQIEAKVVPTEETKQEQEEMQRQFFYQNAQTYYNLIEYFPNIRHIDADKHAENEYNQFRRMVASGNTRDLWDSPITYHDAFEHLKESIRIYHTGDHTESLSERLGNSPAENEREWPQYILNLSQTLGVDVVKVIDGNFFLEAQVPEDAHADKHLINTVEMMKNYKKALVVFELDSLSGVMKDHQQLTEELKAPSITAVEKAGNNAGFSYVKSRPQTFKTALGYGQAAMKQSSSSESELYIVYVSKCRKITQEMKDYLNFPAAPHETAFEDKDFDDEKQQRCKYCLEFYTEKQNQSESKCGKHFGGLYNVSQYNQAKSHFTNQRHADPEGAAMAQIDTFTFDQVRNNLMHAGHQMTDYKWRDNQKGIFEKGPIPIPHSPIEPEFAEYLEAL